MSLRLVPVTLERARGFIQDHHRHNIPPHKWKFGVGVANDTGLVGVAVVARPVSRLLQTNDPLCLEVIRTCTDGTQNANSMLYGAASRASKALGYERLYTYTLAEEPGTSLKATGWVVDAELRPRPTWDTPSRRRSQLDDQGNDRRPPGAKVRWRKDL
jgi:hypothetical protein